MNALPFILFQQIRRIIAPDLYINQRIAVSVIANRLPVIFRSARLWIIGSRCQHTSDFVLRIDFMPSFCRQSACNQLIMSRICNHLFFILFLFKVDTCSTKWQMMNHIDFIECDPVCNQVSEPCKERHRQFFIKWNHSPVLPSSILLNQSDGTVKMWDCNQWFYPISSTFSKHFFVKGKPLFIRLFFVSIGKYPRPADRHTKYRKSHFCKQPDIFFPVMIKIRSFVVRVKFPFQRGRRSHPPFLAHASPGQYIRDRRASAVFVPSSFVLVRRRRAAPEKSIRKPCDFFPCDFFHNQPSSILRLLFSKTCSCVRSGPVYSTFSSWSPFTTCSFSFSIGSTLTKSPAFVTITGVTVW